MGQVGEVAEPDRDRLASTTLVLTVGSEPLFDLSSLPHAAGSSAGDEQGEQGDGRLECTVVSHGRAIYVTYSLVLK